MENGRAEPPSNPGQIDPELLSILVCPACRESVGQQGERLRCGGCGRSYPVRDGIPLMLLDEAAGPETAEGGGAATTESPQPPDRPPEQAGQ